MKTKFEFITAENKRLIISVMQNEAFWSTVFVESDDSLIRLGSEVLHILIEKLIAGLKDPYGRKTTLYEGIKLYHALILGDPHNAICIEPLDEEGGMVLHALDSRFYPVMRLTNQEIDCLIQALVAFADGQETDMQYDEADRAYWYACVLDNTAHYLSMSVEDTAYLLRKHGLLEKVLSAYGWLRRHGGYEYHGEIVMGWIKDAGVLPDGNMKPKHDDEKIYVFWQTEAGRAVWLVRVVIQTAEDLGMSVTDTVALLDRHGIIKTLVSDCDIWNTRDYKYMSKEVRALLNEKGDNADGEG